jgi:hypothetical protein
MSVKSVDLTEKTSSSTKLTTPMENTSAEIKDTIMENKLLTPRITYTTIIMGNVKIIVDKLLPRTRPTAKTPLLIGRDKWYSTIPSSNSSAIT